MTFPIPRPDRRPGVLQLVDTLNTGGAERVAVNLANLLPPEEWRSFLMTSRSGGPLESEIQTTVSVTHLNRRRRFDLRTFRSLRQFIRFNQVRIIHAHAASLFLGVMAKLLVPGTRLLWHDHGGLFRWRRFQVKGDYDRPVLPYFVLTRFVDAEIVVKPELRAYACRVLHLRPDHVHYLPNFTIPQGSGTLMPNDLPGTPETRVLCLANLREQKDHPTLLLAWKQVMAAVPNAHLLLAGAFSKPDYVAGLRRQAADLGLDRCVHFLGPRQDVAALAAACTVGVLSSQNEGFPMSLLEYGTAGLAVVATDVGQCRDILANGEAGLLVPTHAPEPLAAAISQLLQAPSQRQQLSHRLQDRIHTHYSSQAVLDQVQAIYRQLL